MGIRGIDWEVHHVLFEEAAWTSNREAETLREDPGLIIPMYVAPHDELHNEVPFVPLLDAIQVFHINQLFKRQEGPLKNIRELVRCLNVTLERFNHDENDTNLNISLRGKMGELAITAIEAQVPHIRDGMIKPKIRPTKKNLRVDRRRGGRIC